MQFRLTLPGGGEIKMEKEPLTERKFRSLCGLIAGILYVFVAWIAGVY